MSVTFYYVRHGQTKFNLWRRLQGMCDSPLTEKGISDARRAEEALRKVLFDRAYCSSSERCIDTASIVLERHNVVLKPMKALKEIDFGTMDGHLIDEIQEEYDRRKITDNFGDLGGDTAESIYKRITETFNGIADMAFDGEKILIVNDMKRALITGVTGQDGSYLSEFLIEKGYDVHGIIRRSSVDYRERIAHLEGHPQFHLHYGDLGDSMSLVKVVGMVRPDEIYNLAAQSHVQVSFDSPEFTADIDATGVLRVLEAVRACGLEKTCRIYQASTSELYGKVEEVPQNENTPFHPYSPYAVAKLYGFWIVKEYREAYNMFCCSGILFNHESERRGETFVTRKITLAAAALLYM